MPTTQVAVIKQQCQILAGSPGGLNDPNDYENGGDPFASSARELDDLDDLEDEEEL